MASALYYLFTYLLQLISLLLVFFVYAPPPPPPPHSIWPTFCVYSPCVCVCSFPYRDATIESALSVYLPNYVFTWAAVEPIMSYALRLQVFRDDHDDDDDKCRFLEKIVDTADTPQVICTYQHLINCMKSPVKKERKELTVSDSSKYIRKWSHNYLTISYSFFNNWFKYSWWYRIKYWVLDEI